MPSSSPNPEQVVARHLTAERLRSYLAATAGDLSKALALYDWNVAVGGALHEDLGRVEVILRNAIDATLVSHGKNVGWNTVWYDRPSLFVGRHGQRALDDIASAKRRANRRSGCRPRRCDR